MTPDTPIACTLSPSDYRARLAEVATVSRDALRRVEQRGAILDLRYSTEAADRVRALVEKERTCCAFLEFELHEHADEVQLLVTVPPVAVTAIPELLAELTGAGQEIHRAPDVTAPALP